MRGLIKDKDGYLYIARPYNISEAEDVVKLLVWQHFYYSDMDKRFLPSVDTVMYGDTNEVFTDMASTRGYVIKEKLEGGIVETVYVVRTDDELRLVKEYDEADEFVCAVCANSIEKRDKEYGGRLDPTHSMFRAFQKESRALNKTLNEWYGKEKVYLIIPIDFECDEAFAYKFHEPGNCEDYGLLDERIGVVQSDGSWFTTEEFEHTHIAY